MAKPTGVSRLAACRTVEAYDIRAVIKTKTHYFDVHLLFATLLAACFCHLLLLLSYCMNLYFKIDVFEYICSVLRTSLTSSVLQLQPFMLHLFVQSVTLMLDKYDLTDCTVD